MTLPTHYTRCPKCGHQPLPADQSLPTACPGCGVILAKLGTTGRNPNRQPLDSGSEAADAPGWTALLTHSPARVDALQFWSRVAMLAGFAVWSWLLIGMDYRTGEMGASFIHRPMPLARRAGTTGSISSPAWGGWASRNSLAG